MLTAAGPRSGSVPVRAAPLTVSEMIARAMDADTWVDRYAVPAAAATTVVAWLALVVAFIPHLEGSGDAAQLIIAASSIPAALLGWRIVALDPGNVVGRRLVWLGLALTWVWVPIGLLELGAVKLDEPDALWVRVLAIVNANHHVPLYLTLLAVVMVFPDGRAPSPAWRRRALAWNWFFAAALVFSLLDGGALEVIGASDGPAIDSPLPVWKPAEIAGGVFMLILLGVMVATAIAVRGRFKRATGIERLQLSWLSYAASLVPLTIVVCVTEIIVTGGVGMATFAMGMLVTIAVPAAIAVAVRRYRLYDIERLVNRTLVYVALTGTLGAAYAAVAVLVGVAFGGGTPWGTSIAAVVVVMAFRPARDRVQQVVDRRFARRRFEGLRLVEGFLDDVRAGREEPERIGAILAQALNDRGLEVFFRLPASGGYAHASGRLARLPEDGIRVATPVRRGDLELGVILHAPELALRADTFDSIVRAAGLPIEIARLRVEVRVQLAEVEASRARIVAAADAERRKLERDLHDGAQQRLVALGLALRHAQGQLAHEPAGAHQTLEQAVGDVTTAVAELREIARGLRPGVLENGLAGALTDVAARSPVPMALEITREPLPPRMEATVFFLACEAVTNAIKHGGADHIRVRVDCRGEQLRLEVADDGVGGAALCAGGGLAGMSQRALAGGGVLKLDSPPNGGTRISVELPVGLA